MESGAKPNLDWYVVYKIKKKKKEKEKENYLLKCHFGIPLCISNVSFCDFISHIFT